MVILEKRFKRLWSRFLWIVRQIEIVIGVSILRAEYVQIVQSLQDTGPKVVVHPHSITGVTTETEVSDQVLWGVLQQMLYQGVTTALIPYAIHNIAEHDDWSTVVGWLGNSPFDGIPIGLYLSIMCAEDVPHIDFSSPPSMNLGVLSTTQLQEMCEIWNVGLFPRRHQIGPPIYQLYFWWRK